jgi:hypothetical protein
MKGPTGLKLTAGDSQVFKILWSEPKGGKDTVSCEGVSFEEYDSMGHKFYTGFRRFVVVANDAGHCTCM